MTKAWSWALLACATAGCDASSTSDPQLTETRAALSEVLFEENFEGNLGDVTFTGTCYVTSDAAYEGSSGVRCDDDASLTASVSAAGASDLTLSYARRTERYDSGETLRVEYRVDSGAWQLLETADQNDETYEMMTFALGDDADGTAQVEVRFASSASGAWEWFELDSLRIEGQMDGAVEDLCDGVDNDGDGQIDEDFQPEPTVCGIGACQQSGLTQCVDGNVESCTPGTPAPDDATCDGVDDDCDSEVDEDGACGGAIETVFLEDFEDGLGDVTYTGSCSVTDAAAYEGALGVSCGATSSVTLQLDTTGYSDLTLSHAWSNYSYDAGEQIVVEVSTDGTSYDSVGSVGSQGSFQVLEYALGADYAGQPSVYIRYSGNANYSWETFYLDLVEVTGVPEVTSVPDDCDGIDDDGDGQVDEDFESQPTSCGVGACLSQGMTGCVAGDVEDTCMPGTPAQDDSSCNGVDDDCDGQVDEDADCGVSVSLRMAGDGGAFFDMPWPSDHRRQDNGRPDWTGYPGLARGQLGVGEAARDVAQQTTPGFGTSSAVYFSVDGDLDASALPDAVATQQDGSSVMLVNLDDPSAAPVPVLLDYRAQPASATPGQLLAVLPHPGFPLAPDTRYAAIVYTHLPAQGGTLAPAPLLAKLDADDRSGTGLSEDDFALLRSHKAEVDAYVTDHTSLTPASVAAFAVYTTRPFGQEMQAVAASVAAMTDAEVESRVSELSVTQGCDETCPSGGNCNPAVLDGMVETPIYMTPIQFDLNLFSSECTQNGLCASTSGGEIETDGQGQAVLQPWPQGVVNTPLRILVPCTGDRPASGWPVAFHAAGTGGSKNSVGTQTTLASAAGETLRVVAAGIAPWGTDPRQDPDLVETVELMLSQITGDPNPDPDGFMFNFLLNPTAVGSNAVQAAADALFIKRVLAQVPQLTDSWLIRYQLGLSADDLVTDPSQGIMTTQSQGSLGGPLALTVPASQGGYRHAYLNATWGASVYDFITWRADTRGELEGAFQLDPDELDRFHPLGQFLQATTEVARTVNYAHLVQAENLLITGGARDGCSVHEDAGAFITTLYRHGRIDAIETQAAFDGDPEWPVRPVIEGIEDVLGDPLTPLPVSGNLPEGGTGAYLLLEGGHFRSNADPEVGRFLHDVAVGQTPEVTQVAFPGFGGVGCDGRHEPVQ